MLQKGEATIPLIINKTGTLIDGHTRWDILQKHTHIKYSTVARDFDSVYDEKLFIVTVNLKRRHLSRFQRVELALRCKEFISTQARQNQVKAGKNYGNRVSRNQEKQTITPIHTDKKLAAIPGVFKIARALPMHGPFQFVEPSLTDALFETEWGPAIKGMLVEDGIMKLKKHTSCVHLLDLR